MSLLLLKNHNSIKELIKWWPQSPPQTHQQCSKNAGMITEHLLMHACVGSNSTLQVAGSPQPADYTNNTDWSPDFWSQTKGQPHSNVLWHATAATSSNHPL